MSFKHSPVMLDQVVHYLNCGPGGIVVDGTLGGAGHAKAILERILPGGTLIGIDQDPDAFHHAERVLKPYSPSICLFHDNFIHLPRILKQLNITGVDGIVLDLGLSSHQLEASGRGFSFQKDEPLDMRMNGRADITAERLINTMPAEKLQDIFRRYGEERWAGRIARKIVAERQDAPIRTSARLAAIVSRAIPRKGKTFGRGIHPATRVFMALRIAVNSELDVLDAFMTTVSDLLNVGGRLCVISFHSLEDRIVKHRIRAMASACQCPPDFPVCRCGKQPVMRTVVRKVLRPSADELAANPRARSAKLRVAEKV